MSFRLSSLSRTQLRLRQEILEISHRHHFPHLGSCLSMVDILDSIYKVKRPNDVFILSNGHAAIAYYVILRKNGLLTEKEVDELMVHPDAAPERGISVSSGSLGQGLPISIGWALANRKRKIFCTISDGECMEGSIWESLRIIQELKLDNLCITINANGWGAYRPIDLSLLKRQLKALRFLVKEVNGHDLPELLAALKSQKKQGSEAMEIIFAKTNVEQYPFLKGQAAHYHVMTQENYDSTR